MSIYIDSNLLGKAPSFTALLRSLEIAAATDVTVMLQGESGTGKELLANLLHQQSDRRDAPF
ncbi:MAG: sigma-54 factor interaction domain-containing protein, partial [Gammaproteobacteria bacterium]|nr:sigma-54 factor interaction domain-containing protein [Gammaproteobacteria bacterium]